MTARSPLLRFAPVVLALALQACGAPPGMRFYRGTMTITDSSTATTYISTNNGELIHVVPGTADPSRWVFDFQYFAVNATLTGESLSFPAQTFTFDHHGSGTPSSATAMVTGSGSMNPRQVMFNLSLTGTSKYGTTTDPISETFVFNGNRE